MYNKRLQKTKLTVCWDIWDQRPTTSTQVECHVQRNLGPVHGPEDRWVQHRPRLDLALTTTHAETQSSSSSSSSSSCCSSSSSSSSSSGSSSSSSSRQISTAHKHRQLSLLSLWGR